MANYVSPVSQLHVMCCANSRSMNQYNITITINTISVYQGAYVSDILCHIPSDLDCHTSIFSVDIEEFGNCFWWIRWGWPVDLGGHLSVCFVFLSLPV